MTRGVAGDSGVDYWPRWDYIRSRDRWASTTTVADKRAGKVVGKPYWGKPDVRCDEGAGGIVLNVGAHPGA